MMAERIVVYSKENGALTPLTVRVDWLPNGVIRPRMYWTPDGSCLRITQVAECVRLGHLKETGAGVRFRVTAQMAEPGDLPAPFSYKKVATPLPAALARKRSWDSFPEYELYLYLADNFFCAANILGDEYAHNAKAYIPVTLDVFPSGDYELVGFEAGGVCYTVDKTYSVRPGGSYKAGGAGLRHEVEATAQAAANADAAPNSRRAALYLELNKWFVCCAANDFKQGHPA